VEPVLPLGEPLEQLLGMPSNHPKRIDVKKGLLTDIIDIIDIHHFFSMYKYVKHMYIYSYIESCESCYFTIVYRP
jgi:hypothetical protein